MRAITFSQAMLAAACALLVSGCAYPHPGPQLAVDDDALPSSSGATPAASVSPGSSKSKFASTEPAPSTPAAVSSADAPTVTDEQKPQPPPAPMTDSGADTPPPADQGTAGGADAGSGFDNVEIADASLNGKLTVLRVGSQPTPNNLLSVFAGLKNKTAHRLDLEVQTIYKDKEGNALNSGSWIPMTLKPHEEQEYRSASISELATDFLVRVRRAPKPDAGDDGSQ